MVIDDCDPDHLVGTSSSTSVPEPGFDVTVSVPPAVSTRSREQHEAHVPLGPAVAHVVVVEASPVVGDPQAHDVARLRDADRDVARGGVRTGVANRLLRRPEDQLLDLGRHLELLIDIHRDVDAARHERCDGVGQRRGQAVVAQRRGIDLEQHGAELPDRVARPGGGVAQRLAAARRSY